MNKDVFEMFLDEVACELPEEFFADLNGGIIISDEALLHENSLADDLYIMGEYHYDPIIGRHIVIYFGSFNKVFGNLSDRRLKNELRRVLRHEFRHHLESLSGERGLEIEDEMEIEEYLKKHFDKSNRKGREELTLHRPRFKRNNRDK